MVYIKPCKYKYELSRKQRHVAYEELYDSFRMESYLKDYFKSLYGNSIEYFEFKRNVLLTYTTNTALLYSFFVIDRRPRNLVFTRKTGSFMNRKIVLEGSDMFMERSRRTDAIVTPSYQMLFGVEGIEGPMVSILYHYGSMVNKEWYMDLIKVMFGGKESIFGNNATIEVICERIGLRISDMVGKDENEGYNIIPLVSGWMDPFKISQVDPRNLSWF
jgi:transformation/transcription domain-associated protein